VKEWVSESEELSGVLLDGLSDERLDVEWVAESEASSMVEVGLAKFRTARN